MKKNSNIKKIECLDCGYVFKLDKNSIDEKCPKCGSVKKTISIEIVDKFSFKDSVSILGKDKRYNSKKNPRYQLFDGYDFCYDKNEYVKKKRIIDKYNNLYQEIVYDENGNETKLCEEKLTEHYGHGSAKFKNKKS